MNLTLEQRAKLAEWVATGATLAELQTQIAAEFGVKMTYIDVRFLLDDLDLSLVEKKPAGTAKSENSEHSENSENSEHSEKSEKSVPAGVSITVDPVQRPGVIVGGNVTFSDGASGQWLIDGNGRLGLDGFADGYQPPAQDVQEFQILLKQELSKLGYQ